MDDQAATLDIFTRLGDMSDAATVNDCAFVLCDCQRLVVNFDRMRDLASIAKEDVDLRALRSAFRFHLHRSVWRTVRLHCHWTHQVESSPLHDPSSAARGEQR